MQQSPLWHPSVCSTTVTQGPFQLLQSWTILASHVKSVTLNVLSTTRWECNVEAVWYQLPEILEELWETVSHKNRMLMLSLHLKVSSRKWQIKMSWPKVSQRRTPWHFGSVFSLIQSQLQEICPKERFYLSKSYHCAQTSSYKTINSVSGQAGHLRWSYKMKGLLKKRLKRLNCSMRKKKITKKEPRAEKITKRRGDKIITERGKGKSDAALTQNAISSCQNCSDSA